MLMSRGFSSPQHFAPKRSWLEIFSRGFYKHLAPNGALSPQSLTAQL